MRYLLTEEHIREIVGECLFRNYEGILHTFDVDKVITYIKNKYHIFTDNIYEADAEETYGEIPSDFTCHTIIITNFNIRRLEELKKDMAMCGYYLATPTEQELKQIVSPFVDLQFEERNPRCVDDEIIDREKYLLHITPIENLSKILKNGLCPSHKNLAFNFPDRVYLMRGESTNEGLLRIINLIGSLNYISSPKWHKRDEKYRGHQGEYALLKIFPNKIKPKVDFYYDSNYPYGFFTKGNINPLAIEVDRCFKVDEDGYITEFNGGMVNEEED